MTKTESPPKLYIKQRMETENNILLRPIGIKGITKGVLKWYTVIVSLLFLISVLFISDLEMEVQMHRVNLTAANQKIWEMEKEIGLKNAIIEDCQTSWENNAYTLQKSYINSISDLKREAETYMADIMRVSLFFITISFIIERYAP
jgi:hypothetical protein